MPSGHTFHVDVSLGRSSSVAHASVPPSVAFSAVSWQSGETHSSSVTPENVLATGKQRWTMLSVVNVYV